MATPQNTTFRRYNGKDWDPVYLAGDSTIVQVGEEIKVKGAATGSYKDGDTIKSTESVASVLKKLLQARVPATYTKPTVTLAANKIDGTPNAPGQYEAGTAIKAALVGIFTQKDAGALTHIDLKRNNVKVGEGSTTSPLTHTADEVVGEGTIKYEVIATYAEGAIKNDNLEEPSPAGHITAGSVTAAITYTGVRFGFYGADATNGNALTDSASIRKLTKTTKPAANGVAWSVVIPKGSKKFTLAYPDTLRDINKCTYKEMNSNVIPQLVKSTVKVAGAGADEGVNYKVYTIAWAQPTAGNMTFDIVI